MTTEQLITRIDWKLLSQQKQTLIDIIEEKGNAFTIEAENQKSDLEGILNMIDAIQDHAIDDLGIPESDVLVN